MGPHRIVHVPSKRFLVRHLDHLNLERIAVVSFDDDVPRDEATAVLRQQRKYFILERRKVAAPSWMFPQQDAQADRHGTILH